MFNEDTYSDDVRALAERFKDGVEEYEEQKKRINELEEKKREFKKSIGGLERDHENMRDYEDMMELMNGRIKLLTFESSLTEEYLAKIGMDIFLLDRKEFAPISPWYRDQFGMAYNTQPNEDEGIRYGPEELNSLLEQMKEAEQNRLGLREQYRELRQEIEAE